MMPQSPAFPRGSDLSRLVGFKRWKTPRALVRPKGITVNWQSPCGVMNAVFSLAHGCIRICQKPEAKPKVEKYLASPS